LEATEVKFDDTSSPEAIVIGAPESAASQSILLAPAPNANTGVAEPIATPVASPSQSTASALPWTPAEMPPDDAAAFPKQDKPDVPSPADKAVESLPQAHDMPTKGATTSPGFVQRDAKQELWQEWAVKFDMVERENIALHDKLRALGADGLGDIRVDAVAQIENDSLRKRIAELEKQIDDLRQQAADKNKIGGKDVIKSPSDPKSGTPQTSGY
jgi:BMFP domain-containing protein YqiC